MHGLRSKPIESACRTLVPYEPNWHAIVGAAFRELSLVKQQILGEAEVLATEINGAVRHKLTRQLISRARTAGFSIGEEILRAAGFTPASFWAILDAPMRFAPLIQLLADWTLDPQEKVGAYDPRTHSGAFDTHTAAHWRLFQALKTWIESGRLDGKLDGILDGKPDGTGYVTNPREAVRLLMTSPPHRDLVPASLTRVLVAEPPLPTVSESAPAQLTKDVTNAELARFVQAIVVPENLTLDQAEELAEEIFPGKHLSRERLRVASSDELERVTGHKPKRGRRPKGTGPSPRPKS
jgi:hypothetical protein